MSHKTFDPFFYTLARRALYITTLTTVHHTHQAFDICVKMNTYGGNKFTDLDDNANV